MRLITVVPRSEDVSMATAHIAELCDRARIEGVGNSLVMVGEFADCVRQAPASDMDILGLRSGPDLEFVGEMVRATRSSCMFAADSGLERVLA
ncbi:MAG: hypothetical protein ABIZ91_15090 [Gemmatimonadaceae bacterium]